MQRLQTNLVGNKKPCPVCNGTGKCPVCGIRAMNTIQWNYCSIDRCKYCTHQGRCLVQIIINIQQEIFDLTHEKGKNGEKRIPKWVLLDSIDKVRHVSSLKSILADLRETIR